jgi:signal transduction histidine kinase
MLQVMDENYRLISGFGLPDADSPSESLYTRVDSASHAAEYAYVFHNSHLDLRVPVMLDGARVGSLVLRSSLAPVYDQLYSLMQICGAVFLGSIFVAYFVTTLLLRIITAPLLAFRNRVRLVKNTGDYSIRVPRTTNDETGELISGFNSMLEEIRKRDDSLEQNRRNLEQTIRERTLGMEAALQDVTREKDRAEQANLAKSEFLAMMSHEIRTPMNGILGMTSMLADADLPEEYRSYARTAQESCEVLLTLINDILDFSRIEAGRVELENEPFDLAKLVENTASLFRNEALQKNLDLVVDTSGLPATRLKGDIARIRQILINLLGNAFKFTDKGRITVRGEQVSQEGSGYCVRLTVADTGIGITSELQNRIFDTFAQADASTTRKFGGSGLGLAICKKIATLMHGRIGVDSKPESGSAFWLELPLERAEAKPGPADNTTGRIPETTPTRWWRRKS